jgi:5-(carboxyamino)imidazole ribonucleotide mutase
MKVVIVTGSDSDMGHATRIKEELSVYDFENADIRVCSAHKDPLRLMKLLQEYSEGPLTWVSVAGKTDALSGLLSFHSNHPVISCPPDPPNESCLNNPRGSSNATIYYPENVARFIAQMYGFWSPSLAHKLSELRQNKIEQLATFDEHIEKLEMPQEGE